MFAWGGWGVFAWGGGVVLVLGLYWCWGGVEGAKQQVSAMLGLHTTEHTCVLQQLVKHKTESRRHFHREAVE